MAARYQSAIGRISDCGRTIFVGLPLQGDDRFRRLVHEHASVPRCHGQSLAVTAPVEVGHAPDHAVEQPRIRPVGGSGKKEPAGAVAAGDRGSRGD